MKQEKVSGMDGWMDLWKGALVGGWVTFFKRSLVAYGITKEVGH